MITSCLPGSVFELKTGIPWTAGLSPYRDGAALKLRWEKVGAIGGRWFFEIDGVLYSAKSISPHLKDIQMHTEYFSPIFNFPVEKIVLDF